MKYHITHPTKSFDAEIDLPYSKSISNRALIIQALCQKTFKISNLSSANDTIILSNALNQTSSIFDLEDCGTAFRFLTAYLATTPGEFTLTGTQRMKKRPVKDLVNALNSLGAKVHYLEEEGFPPLKIKGKPLNGGTIHINTNISSQFVSALLLIAPRLKNELVLYLEGPLLSKPYISMTIEIMRYFGVFVKWNGNTITITPQPYLAKDLNIEADWSSLAFFLEAMVLSKNATLKINGLFKNSWQGDAAVLKIFNSLGVNSEFQSNYLFLKKEKQVSSPSSFDINLLNYPDLAPAYCCTIAAINKTAKVSGLNNLIFKESNRLKTLQMELKKINQETSYSNTDFKLLTSKLTLPQSPFTSHNDHRIAMSLAPLALLFDIEIDGVESVQKSFPNYWKEVQKLGFIISDVTH